MMAELLSPGAVTSKPFHIAAQNIRWSSATTWESPLCPKRQYANVNDMVCEENA